MKIAIVNLTGGGISGGYRKYLTNILPAMVSHPDIDSILCAYPPTLDVENWIAPHQKLRLTHCRPFKFMRHAPDPELKRTLDDFRPDVLFIPVERYLGYGRVPIVTMIQNMAPLAGVKTTCGFVEKLKSLVQYLESKFAVKNAAQVIAPTNFVKDFLINDWHTPLRKISLIYHGANPPGENTSVRPSLLSQELAGRFIFTVGSLEPYRGPEDAILALNHLKQKNNFEHKLVIAGRYRPGTIKYYESLKRMVASHNLSQDVLWLGNLNEDELSWCYGNSSVFVMTSKVESFSMVAVEAMSHGCNCISTDSPCLPEIFKDSAVYYKAGDPRALAESIKTTLERSPGEYAEKSKTALNRAKEFSWDITAAMTVDVFKKAVKLK